MSTGEPEARGTFYPRRPSSVSSRCLERADCDRDIKAGSQEHPVGKLNGKVAVVTGASKGIGASIAKAFAMDGASVTVNYATSKADADRVVDEIKRIGGMAVPVQADLSKATDVVRLFSEAKAAFGTVDILVNNAGVFDFAPLENITEDEFHRHFNINVLGPILAIREAVKYFGPLGGSVINISSLASESAGPNAVVYAASKAALDTVTRVLAKELGPRGIRVNAIAPGAVNTEGTRSLGIVGNDFEQRTIAQTPLGRFGQPDDISPVAVFLASDDSRWVTGERITASGGLR
jgi:3-oxoacyl-[acyl-carrier protein] reductase